MTKSFKSLVLGFCMLMVGLVGCGGLDFDDTYWHVSMANQQTSASQCGAGTSFGNTWISASAKTNLGPWHFYQTGSEVRLVMRDATLSYNGPVQEGMTFYGDATTALVRWTRTVVLDSINSTIFYGTIQETFTYDDEGEQKTCTIKNDIDGRIKAK